MSINGHIREITPALLRRIQGDPSLTRPIILGANQQNLGLDSARTHYERLQASYPTAENEALARALEQMSPAQQKMAMLAVSKLSEFVKQASTQSSRVADLEPGSLGDHLRLGQAWHGLHFLLAGSADPTSTPLGQAILGGTEIGEDTGYGSPRYLDAVAVAAIAKALAAVSASELRDRYDGDAMNDAELYPNDWSEPATVGWLTQEFDRLREFYAGAASRGNAVLLYHI